MSPLLQFLLASAGFASMIGLIFFMARKGPRDGSTNRRSDGLPGGGTGDF